MYLSKFSMISCDQMKEKADETAYIANVFIVSSFHLESQFENKT
jgi:hypothetical protein